MVVGLMCKRCNSVINYFMCLRVGVGVDLIRVPCSPNYPLTSLPAIIRVMGYYLLTSHFFEAAHKEAHVWHPEVCNLRTCTAHTPGRCCMDNMLGSRAPSLRQQPITIGDVPDPLHRGLTSRSITMDTHEPLQFTKAKSAPRLGPSRCT